MIWLLWKEFRLQRFILVVGLFLFVIPYLFLTYWISRDVNADYLISFTAASSMILSILTLALLGGNAIACERADRSAEFLAYQPIHRCAALLNKLVLPVAAAVLLWGANLLVFIRWASPEPNLQMDLAWMLTFVALGFCAFSVAWLLSAVQSSPTLAAGAGMVAPIALMMFLALVYWVSRGLLPASSFQNVWLFLNILMALGCVTAGSWHYVRRVEP